MRCPVVLLPDTDVFDIQALIADRMLECYRTPAGKQERQAQVEPLRREVREALVGTPNNHASAGSNGASPPAAAYTDANVNAALKVCSSLEACC